MSSIASRGNVRIAGPGPSIIYLSGLKGNDRCLPIEVYGYYCLDW